MTLEKRIATLFGMSPQAWERHTNPWSVWTRNSALPIVVLAAWSRVWLEWWALVPLAAALLWTWLNPRLFARPRSTDNWASKSVLGERVWLNRRTIPVPPHHRVLPNVLNLAAGIGAVIVVVGVVSLDVWTTVLGSVIVYFAKLWYLDRMVWLYDEMKDSVPEYRAWLY